MFNGLIRELATVQGYANNILSLRASYKPNLGDSIAVNGACLTVTQVFANGFAVELSKETRLKIATQNLKGKVLINSIGTVIGSHTGSGTVALFFVGDERTE